MQWMQSFLLLIGPYIYISSLGYSFSRLGTLRYPLASVMTITNIYFCSHNLLFIVPSEVGTCRLTCTYVDHKWKKGSIISSFLRYFCKWRTCSTNKKKHSIVFSVFCTTGRSALQYCGTSDTVVNCKYAEMCWKTLLYQWSRRYDHTAAEVLSTMLWHCFN